MKKEAKETKTRVYNLVVSKLVYLEAMKIVEKHSVWWSKVKVIETGDPIHGSVYIRFRYRIEDKELVDNDIAYIQEVDAHTKSLYDRGKINS